MGYFLPVYLLIVLFVYMFYVDNFTYFTDYFSLGRENKIECNKFLSFKIVKRLFKTYLKRSKMVKYV